MDLEHLEQLAVAGEDYWWSVAKRDLAAQLLRVGNQGVRSGRIVVGGIGPGHNAEHFARLGFEVLGLDCCSEAVARCAQRSAVSAQVHDIQERWPMAARSVDGVLLLDVIEHVDRPIDVLMHARDVLKPEGRIVVTVPAYGFLFGPWDRALEHRRRYTVAMLRAQAREAGLRLRWGSHWNSFSLPVGVPMRLKQKWFGGRAGALFPPVSPRVNEFLLQCARVERTIMRHSCIPFGLSVVGVLTP